MKRSNFVLPKVNKLPPIKLTINKYMDEVKDNLISLREEKLFQNKMKSRLISYKLLNHLKKENSELKINLNESLQKKNKSTNEKKIRITLNNYLTERINKIKEKEKKKEKAKLNLLQLIKCKSYNNIYVNKNQMMNKIKEINDKSFETNKYLLKENLNHHKIIFNKIKKNLQKDKKMLFVNDEYLKPEISKKFDIKIKLNKRNAFYNNLDNIITKINENSKSSQNIVQEMKSLNIKGHKMYKREKELEIRKRGFEKFNLLSSKSEILRNEIMKIE